MKDRTEYDAAYRKRNKIQIAAKKRAYYVANEEKLRAKQRAYYAANPEKARATDRAYHATYRAANLEKVRASSRAYAQRNPHKRLAAEHKRRAAKLSATPSWATGVDQHVEQLALQRSGAQHIDHIVPLNGKFHNNHPIQLVCGLHAEDNLQLMPAAKNLSKGCSEWPDMWDYTAGHMAEIELLAA